LIEYVIGDQDQLQEALASGRDSSLLYLKGRLHPRPLAELYKGLPGLKK
jgi:hypothetical protein